MGYVLHSITWESHEPWHLIFRWCSGVSITTHLEMMVRMGKIRWFTRILRPSAAPWFTSLGYGSAWLAPKIVWALLGLCWPWVRFTTRVYLSFGQPVWPQNYPPCPALLGWCMLMLQSGESDLATIVWHSLRNSRYFCSVFSFLPPTTGDELAGTASTYWPLSR